MDEAATGANAVSHPLDDPVRSALTGPHAHLAEWRGRVVRYPPDVLKFIAIPYPATAKDWAEAAALAGPDQAGAGVVVAPPADWLLSSVGPRLQLVEDHVQPRFDAEAMRLGPADVPEIVEFVARHRNGRRFPPRTLETGTYLGFRRDGALVAMAGERLRPAGWSELSAVCNAWWSAAPWRQPARRAGPHDAPDQSGVRTGRSSARLAERPACTSARHRDQSVRVTASCWVARCRRPG